MRRKALVGIFVIGLVLGIIPISRGIENSDFAIKMPDELPNGQKLVKTGGEEIIHEDMSRHFPHYISCNAYFYSVKPTYESYSTEQTGIIVCAFNSENDAKGDLQNLVINDPQVILLSDFVENMAKETGVSESEFRKELESDAPSYLECDIPDACMIGEFDGILFPLGKNVVWVASEEEALRLPEIAEAVYSLNVGTSPTSSPMPGEKKSDYAIKMPDELPTGQKLVKTGGEEMLREDVGETFPHYTGCNVYGYSVNSSLGKYPPGRGETLVIVSTFNSENDAKRDLYNVSGVMPTSEFISKYREELEKYPEYMQTLLDFNRSTTIPEAYMGGDGDVVLFPLGNKIVLVWGENFFTVAEAVYALNAETPTPGPKQPGFEAVFAIAGLLAMVYLIKRRKEMKG